MAATKSKRRMRAYGEAREVRDQEWLRLHQEGEPASAIAEEAGVSVQLVRRALARAREQAESRGQDDAERTIPDTSEGAEGSTEKRPPAEASAMRRPWWLELVPLFPIGAFTPASECPHRGPIAPGSLLCCMVCSASGVDQHPYLGRDPKTDPRPEPKPAAAGVPPKGRGAAAADSARETRKERRARRYGDRRPGEVGPAVQAAAG